MPVDVAAFYLAIQQTDSLDKQIKDKMLGIQNKQADIAQAREYLAKMKELQANAKDKKGDCPWDKKASMMPQEMADWLDAHGVAYDRRGNDLAHNEKEWDVNIEHLNAYIQNSNSSVELDMLSIQSLMNKRNQSLEMASTIMKKSTDSKESILGTCNEKVWLNTTRWPCARPPQIERRNP